MILALISIIVFIFLLYINYMGSVGRIERKNQATGQFQNLGPVSQKEEEAYMNGTYKKLAFKQAFIGALVWALVLYGIMYFIGSRL